MTRGDISGDLSYIDGCGSGYQPYGSSKSPIPRAQ
jgi:hypothetical protein